mgnify:FL=1
MILPMDNLRAKMEFAASFLNKRLSCPPKVGIILGTGLGGLTAKITEQVVIPYKDIPYFPRATVKGHAGKLVSGQLAARPVVAFGGRFHYYEGYTMGEITFPIRVMQLLGIKYLIITNAAGGMNPDFTTGDLMIIQDHINLMGDNPLIGPNDPELGPRFPELSQAYNYELRQLAIRKAAEAGISVKKGVYVAVPGPNFETPAELIFLARIGGDAVGMSTVPEVIAACHAGLKVLGISCITNKADGHHPHAADHEEVLAAAARAGGRLQQLVELVVSDL